MSRLEQSIDAFLGYFEKRVAQVRSTEFEEADNLFKKILYVGFIDALSKTTAYKKKGNRERLVSFIVNFSGWTDCEKVSLPHLIRLLEKIPDPEFSKVREFAYSRYDTWRSGSMIRLDADPDYKEIKKLWPNSVTKPFEDIQLDFIQHKNLFYRYRNSLVHELRTPGYGIEFKEDSPPFYHSMHRDEPEDLTWELVYPLGFYEEILKHSLVSLREYYLTDRIDPYKCFNYGTYWLDELN